MLRKRSTVLTIRSIPKLFAPPLLSSSSNKATSFIRYRNFITVAQRSDLLSDPNDSSPQIPFGPDSGTPSSRSSNGFSKRSDFDEVRQSNSNGFNRENSSNIPRIGDDVGLSSFNGHQGSSFGEDNQFHSNAYNAVNPTVPQRTNNFGELRGSNSNGLYRENQNQGAGYQTSNFREVPGLNSNGYNVENQNGDQRNWYQRGNFGGVQQLNTNGVNSGEFHPNPSFDNSKAGVGEFYQNSSGFYRETPNQRSVHVVQRPNSHEFYQSPHTAQHAYGYSGINLMQIYQNSIGYSRQSQVQEGQQNSNQFPLVSGLLSDKAPESGESIIYRGPLDELDEFCKENKVKEAVEVLGLLRNNGVAVDLPRYLTLLQVCGEAQSLEEARIVHDHISQAIGDVGVVVNNKILDMYAKCGLMADAYELFEKMPQRNLTSWDTMLMGFVNSELGEEAIDLFTEFKELGLKPDGGLFVSVLNACGVLGAIDEGMLYFESMKVDFGIAPSMKHYVSIVDLLGRSGYLDEALEFIEKMPIEPSVDVWETLMNLCRANGYEELGNRCFGIVEQLDSSRLTDETKMGLLPMKAYEIVKKNKSNSSLPDNTRRIHNLRAGDRSHPESDRIYAQIGILKRHMKEAGYVPDTKPVLHDIDEESKEDALFAHSERLATAYSLLTSPARSQIRILKNLRFCRDCHETMKFISKLTGRTLIIRDTKRFHHFTNGACSCNDYY